MKNEDIFTETESSPSGYETESSSDGEDGDEHFVAEGGDADDDTDIDGVFDEYRGSASLATISFPSRPANGK